MPKQRESHRDAGRRLLSVKQPETTRYKTTLTLPYALRKKIEKLVDEICIPQLERMSRKVQVLTLRAENSLVSTLCPDVHVFPNEAGELPPMCPSTMSLDELYKLELSDVESMLAFYGLKAVVGEGADCRNRRKLLAFLNVPDHLRHRDVSDEVS